MEKEKRSMLKFGGVVIEVGVKYGLSALVWFGKLRGYGRKGTWNWNVYNIIACHRRRRGHIYLE
jgi:hypothetical protein